MWGTLEESLIREGGAAEEESSMLDLPWRVLLVNLMCPVSHARAGSAHPIATIVLVSIP
jgi:hypothetical protein